MSQSAPLPDAQTLYKVVETTWPAFASRTLGPWTLRDGRGGGKRVSAATAQAPASADDLPPAEAAMRAYGEVPRFMIRAQDNALDAMLAQAGYDIIDPVNMYAGPIAPLTVQRPPPISTFNIWPPVAIQREIWAAGGIGPARIHVMERAPAPKTALLGRENDRAAAAGFVAIHDGIAMVHALEVLPAHRRQGLARYMMLEAAFWAAAQGAHHMSVVCTRANDGANALYSSLGLSLVGQYHYRQLTDGNTP
ncbi:GNAT family N-acetyltransferase [Rhodobacteraceae bacterium KMM 6894]|nr:GNAT family N-acetyltransferase [Rhodobacteraceae bacterium KMM 6894]